MSESCLFCRIVERGIPADIVAEGDGWLAFRDLHPQAPTHVLIVPRRHVASIDDLGSGDEELAGVLITAAADVARASGLVEHGYRLVFNVGAGAGQSVGHVHLHLLGGRAFSWPPG